MERREANKEKQLKSGVREVGRAPHFLQPASATLGGMNILNRHPQRILFDGRLRGPRRRTRRPMAASPPA